MVLPSSKAQHMQSSLLWEKMLQVLQQQEINNAPIETCTIHVYIQRKRAAITDL